MQFDRSAQGILRLVGLCIFLCYPIMAIKWLPFGGGARYLSILAAPIGLILLLQAPRLEVRELLASSWRFSLPFLPFVLAWVFAEIWHAEHTPDFTPLTRLLWSVLLFIGALRLGVSYRHLALSAGTASLIYCVVAIFEVYGMGRDRAWGGTYENRFGQYAIWVSSLSCLHVFWSKSVDQTRLSKSFLLIAAGLGAIAAVLSGSRGALGGLLVVMMMLLFKANQWRRGVFLAIGMALVFIVFALIYEPMYLRINLAYQEALNYFREPVFNPTSIGIRLELFRIAFLTLLDHPVLGPGYTSLKQLYETHPALGVPSQEMLSIPKFHNDWANAVGVGGGMLLSALLMTCIWMFVSARKNNFCQAFLGFSVVFSFSEVFLTDKMGLSLLMASWALYSAAEANKNKL